MNEEAIIRAGQKIGEPKSTGIGAYAVIPNDSKVEDLEQFAEMPRQARASVEAADVGTLCSYVSKFKTDATALFADPDNAAFKIVGILDYHTTDKPSHRVHRVTYTAPKSREWQTWRGASGKKADQTTFAQFIEDNQVDIVFPVGAEILEVSRSLSAHKAVEFVSAVSLTDGSRQLTYNETVDGATARGNIKVPDEFVLGIPVFFGGPRYDIRARLRYRIEGGKLSLWFDLYRPEYIEKDAFDAVIATVAEATNVEVWRGKP